MLIKGIYLDRYIILKRIKDTFKIVKDQERIDYAVMVLPPKDVLVILKQDAYLENTLEISGYKFLTKRPIDFEAEDIWVFSLLRALELMQYDNVYIVFEDSPYYVLCRVENSTLTYYEVFFDKDELNLKLNTLEGDIVFDIEDIHTNNLRILPLLYIQKGELLAFGGALKKIKDRFYKNDVISLKKLKKELINIAFLSVAIIFGYIVFSFSINYQTNILRQKEEKIFERAFPDTPIVDIGEQVKALMIPKDSFRVSKLLLKAYSNLPSDAKVYELFYKNDTLSVKSEVNSYEVKTLENITFSRALPSNLVEITQTWTLKR